MRKQETAGRGAVSCGCVASGGAVAAERCACKAHARDYWPSPAEHFPVARPSPPCQRLRERMGTARVPKTVLAERAGSSNPARGRIGFAPPPFLRKREPALPRTSGPDCFGVRSKGPLSAGMAPGDSRAQTLSFRARRLSEWSLGCYPLQKRLSAQSRAGQSAARCSILRLRTQILPPSTSHECVAPRIATHARPALEALGTRSAATHAGIRWSSSRTKYLIRKVGQVEG
jgi:hypothetical protein